MMARGAERSPAPSAEQDRKLEVAIGQMLRIGVTVAAAVILLGGILYLQHPGGRAPDYSHFHAAPAEVLSVHGTLAGVLHGSALSIIQLGILLLIATPVVRVIFALVGFLHEGDRMYAWISAGVLAILIFSLAHSR